MAQLVENLPATWEAWVLSLGWDYPQEMRWPPTTVFWPGEFHGLYSPWGLKESDTTEWLSLSTHIIKHSINYLINLYYRLLEIHLFKIILRKKWGFPGGSDGKEWVYQAGDPGLIPGSVRSPGEGHSKPLQYSCLENFMDRGAWQATVHGFTKSRTQLSD